MRQVTHALLTRPPLSHSNNQSEEIKLKCFVRLACVKHAASVHPEPGSNSHVKSFFLTRNFHLAYCFWFKDCFFRSHLFRSQFLNLLQIHSIDAALLLRIFKVALLFICQGSKRRLRHRLEIHFTYFT